MSGIVKKEASVRKDKTLIPMQLDDLWFGRFLFVLRHFFFYFLCALLFFPFFSSSSFFRYSFCLLSLADSLLFDCLCVVVLHNISPVWGFLYSCNSSCWSYLSLTVVVFFWCAQRWLDVVCTFSFVLSLYFGAEIPYLRECEIQRFEMRDNSATMYCICECRFF